MKKAISFESLPLGMYSEAQIQKDWNNPKRIMGAGDGRCAIVADPLNASRNVLEIKYPNGKVGQEIGGGGAQWRLRFEKSFSSCTAEYQVMFPVGFDFVKGGKLPGLCGERTVRYFNICIGWSVHPKRNRVMIYLGSSASFQDSGTH